jgi:hypothetical protein
VREIGLPGYTHHLPENLGSFGKVRGKTFEGLLPVALAQKKYADKPKKLVRLVLDAFVCPSAGRKSTHLAK